LTTYLLFGGRVFQQTIGILMVTNCTLFLYSYETDFIHGLLKKNEKKLSDLLISCFAIKIMYGNYICWSNLSHWTGNTTDTARLASYHQSHLEIDNDDRLRTKLYDKNDYFNFPILDFPFKYVATFQQHLYMEYIFLSRSDIPQLVVTIGISLIEGWC
jgi:hypothetical protein